LKLADLASAPDQRRTARLLLRVPGPADGALLMDSFNASLPAYRFIHWAQRRSGPFTLQEAADLGGRLLGYHRSGSSLHYLVLRTAEAGAEAGAVVGLIDLHSFDFEAPRVELGYVGDVRQAGRGLMREAVMAATEIAFELGFIRVQALSDARNTRALHFAESLPGFRREGELRGYEPDPWGAPTTQVMFAALRPGLVLATEPPPAP